MSFGNSDETKNWKRKIGSLGNTQNVWELVWRWHQSLTNGSPRWLSFIVIGCTCHRFMQILLVGDSNLETGLCAAVSGETLPSHRHGLKSSPITLRRGWIWLQKLKNSHVLYHLHQKGRFLKVTVTDSRDTYAFGKCHLSNFKIQIYYWNCVHFTFVN